LPPATSSRSEAISALSDLISRSKGAVSSCMILRSALRSLLSFSACSSPRQDLDHEDGDGDAVYRDEERTVTFHGATARLESECDGID
jgi:hypothetical protein